MGSSLPRVADLDAVVFDFDGVLTDNCVFVDQHGGEWVRCSRADGLAFDVLRKLEIKTYILSTEKNAVVSARAEKLKVPVLQGIADKASAIKGLAEREGCRLENIVYVGNDLNDYYAMGLCGIRVCPADSHSVIKQIATVELQSPGGAGVARELLEDVFGLNFLEILYPR